MGAQSADSNLTSLPAFGAIQNPAGLFLGNNKVQSLFSEAPQWPKPTIGFGQLPKVQSLFSATAAGSISDSRPRPGVRPPTFVTGARDLRTFPVHLLEEMREFCRKYPDTQLSCIDYTHTRLVNPGQLVYPPNPPVFVSLETNKALSSACYLTPIGGRVMVVQQQGSQAKIVCRTNPSVGSEYCIWDPSMDAKEPFSRTATLTLTEQSHPSTFTHQANDINPSSSQDVVTTCRKRAHTSEPASSSVSTRPAKLIWHDHIDIDDQHANDPSSQQVQKKPQPSKDDRQRIATGKDIHTLTAGKQPILFSFTDTQTGHTNRQRPLSGCNTSQKIFAQAVCAKTIGPDDLILCLTLQGQEPLMIMKDDADDFKSLLSEIVRVKDEGGFVDGKEFVIVVTNAMC